MGYLRLVNVLLHFSFLSLSYPVIWSIYPSEKNRLFALQRKWHAEKVAFPPPAIWRRENLRITRVSTAQLLKKHLAVRWL